jgi:glutamyl-tRNA synthetase
MGNGAKSSLLSPLVSPLRTRFAPSPTGDLHLGGLVCAFASFVVARATSGRFVVRVEDIDTPRVVPGACERILEDLEALGLSWDELDRAPTRAVFSAPPFAKTYAPYTQSLRHEKYAAAIEHLDTYPCDCSRQEIAQVASAPHAGEELVYPGTCRDKPEDREMKRPPAVRLRVPRGEASRVVFDDLYRGEQSENVAERVGDFVLRRGDGVYAYQLACALDDHAMDIELVLRGHDLLGSTARQILLGRLLGYAKSPRYGHLPLVVTPSGERLAKRTRGTTVREMMARGVAAKTLFGFCARACGIDREDAPVELERAIALAERALREDFVPLAEVLPLGRELTSPNG